MEVDKKPMFSNRNTTLTNRFVAGSGTCTPGGGQSPYIAAHEENGREVILSKKEEFSKKHMMINRDIMSEIIKERDENNMSNQSLGVIQNMPL